MKAESAHLIDPQRPFSLELCVRSHGWYQCPPFRWLPAEGTLLRGERDGERDYLITTRQRTDGQLELRVAGPAVDGPLGLEMARRMTAMLRLDEDLAGFATMAAGKPKLASIVGQGWGRILRGGSLWEDVSKALMGTNTTWRQAVRCIDQLARFAPSSSHVDGLPLYPTAAEIAGLDEPTVRDRVRCGYRAPFLLSIARGAVDGTFDLEGLDREGASLSVQEADKRLRELPGIGPATSAYLLVFLGHYDRPTIDSATVAFAAKHYFDGEKRSPKEVGALFDHYAPYRALGTWGEVWQSWQGDKETRDGLG